MLLRCVILAAALGLLGAAVQSEPAPTPFILFSASTGGQVRSCRCPSMPWGGLAKRAWLIGQLRQAAGPGNVLLLDAGDLLPAAPDAGLTDCVLRLYALMRYDAVAVGDQELSLGIEAWQALDPAPPWLSAGYTSAAGPRRGATIAQPWRLFDVAGLRLGVGHFRLGVGLRRAGHSRCWPPSRVIICPVMALSERMATTPSAMPSGSALRPRGSSLMRWAWTSGGT